MAIKSDITEKELVQSCLHGDTSSQKKLYTKYSPIMFAICMRYAKNVENAQDLLQESFIKAFDGLKKFKFEGSFEGWLKRLTVNTCLDFNKKIRSEPYGEELDQHFHVGTQEVATANMQAQDLINLLQQLPAGYRTVFNLFAIEGYTHTEIANELGVTENTSKTQLFKARKMLQFMLAKMEKE